MNILLQLVVVNYLFSGCWTNSVSNVTTCVEGTVLGTPVTGINEQRVVKYCSKPMDLIHIAEFCEKYVSENCDLINRGFDDYMKDHENYRNRRINHCRLND